MNTRITAGYSGTPLAKKLGFKPGQHVYLEGAPDNYFDLVEPLPENLTFKKRLGKGLDIIHLFTASRAELAQRLPRYLERLNPGGAIWVSWPKRAAKIPADITENDIREAALPLGLVDVKVCAVDQTWSGLRLVRRRT